LSYPIFVKAMAQETKAMTPETETVNFAAVATYSFDQNFTFSTVTTEVPCSPEVIPMPKPKKLAVVNNRYTFHHDLDLKIGDEVVCESADGHQWIGVVTATESTTYQGNTKALVKKFVGNLAAKVSFKNIDDLKQSFRKCQTVQDVRMVANALWVKTKGYQFSQEEIKTMLGEIKVITLAELAKYQAQEVA